ncbi:MAG: hypothetical protein ACI4JA_01150 [Oscillospiraceae bacterium]
MFAETDKGSGNFSFSDNFPFNGNAVVDLSGATLSPRSLEKILRRLGFNPVIDLSNAVITDSDDDEDDTADENTAEISDD